MPRKLLEGPGSKKKPQPVSLEERQWEAIDRIATAKAAPLGKSPNRSALLREILADHLEEYEQKYVKQMHFVLEVKR